MTDQHTDNPTPKEPPANGDTHARGGAPFGNSNRTRHGLHGLTLPRDCRHVESALRAFRRELERVVFDAREVVGVRDAGLIQSACRHERRARLAEQWLRREWDDLSTTDRLAILREASNATDARDKCIDKLKLPADDAEDFISRFYRRPLPAPKPQDAAGEPFVNDSDSSPAEEAESNATEPGATPAVESGEEVPCDQ